MSRTHIYFQFRESTRGVPMTEISGQGAEANHFLSSVRKLAHPGPMSRNARHRVVLLTFSSRAIDETDCWPLSILWRAWLI